MSTISMFFGILIRMLFYDTEMRKMPHIHAEYQGQLAVYSIPDGNVLAGELPAKKYGSSHGSKYIKRILLIGNWLSMAGNPFQSEAFEPLKSRDEFERIHNGQYFIEWDCGADLSADTIQARW